MIVSIDSIFVSADAKKGRKAAVPRHENGRLGPAHRAAVYFMRNEVGRLQSPVLSFSPDPDCSGVATLEERVLEAQHLHGEHARTAVLESTFLFVDPERTPLFEASLDLARHALAALRHDRIDAPLRMRRDAPVGGRDWALYDAARSEIVVDVSGGPKHVNSLAHELAHVLVGADWAMYAPAPAWFDECVASLYEAPVFPADGEIHGASDWRYTQLRAALAVRDPAAHMAALFGMADPVFRGHMGPGTGYDATLRLLHEATARATCQWLDEQRLLWPLYRAWRDAYLPSSDPDGVATFTRIVGRPPSAAEADWAAWITHPPAH